MSDTRLEMLPRELLEEPRVLSEADCQAIARRLTSFARGGGRSMLHIQSQWRGNLRWARNRITTSGDVRNYALYVDRYVNGAGGEVRINDVTDAALTAADRRAERLVEWDDPYPLFDTLIMVQPEPFATPALFSTATADQDATLRAEVARSLMQSAIDAGMMSAGYITVAARSMAHIDAFGRTCYCQWTEAQYSVTVRDPKGNGSGWAGVDWHDWTKIDGPALSAVALQKCLQSRNPVAIEPGRYTTILEPQAVCDFVGQLICCPSYLKDRLDRQWAEESLDSDPDRSPFIHRQLGEKVFDERITISADPMDPELGFPPFDSQPWYLINKTYHPAVWIENGVLKNMSYNRDYAIHFMGQNTGLPNSGAFRMGGGPTTVAEMIATTKRGLLVTRFDALQLIDGYSITCRGYTRDGLWLIEDGKISKPVKNMMVVESVMFALNNVEQLGTPQRVFHPCAGKWDAPQPVVVPPLKINDFNFTALASAV